jgi:hypothetical protein
MKTFIVVSIVITSLLGLFGVYQSFRADIAPPTVVATVGQ